MVMDTRRCARGERLPGSAGDGRGRKAAEPRCYDCRERENGRLERVRKKARRAEGGRAGKAAPP